MTRVELDKITNNVKAAVESSLKEVNDEVLTIKGAAAMMNLSIWAIYTRCRKNQIPYTKKHGRLYFSKNAINKYYLNQ